MKLTKITECRECGGTSLTWDTVNRVRNGVQQNRLNTRDVDCVFFLGCDDCSETLATVSADRVAAMLNASAEPATPAEHDERADFETWAKEHGLPVTRAPTPLAFHNGTRRNVGDYMAVESLCAHAAWIARADLEKKA